jgi:8-oxo-dGTP pyrophosphatase MutT (NUDIX family)
MDEAQIQHFVDQINNEFNPNAEETENWGSRHPKDAMPLRIRSYVVAQVPPLEAISSVRCVVLRVGESSQREVLAMENPDGWALLPGGRREKGETLLETLHRELLEESGWTIADPTLLGFIHYRHLGEKPADYLHPYPHFMQVVYTASALAEYPERRVDDPFEQPARFIAVERARGLQLHARDRVFLEAALKNSR